MARRRARSKPTPSDTTALSQRRSWAERSFGSGPFGGLAKTHAGTVGADAFFAVSLAGSLFFSVSIDAARPRIILYLALTMAPFAVVTPLIGPLIDRVRGGQRLVIGFTAAGRALLCLVMANELRTLLFYPLAFTALALGKTYSVAKNSLVPRLMADAETLVWANSRLSRTASIAGALAGAMAAAMQTLTSAPWVLRAAGGLYLASGAFALRLPRPSRGASRNRAAARAELRVVAMSLAASAMGTLRAGEGFLLFLFAFALKQSGAPAWLFGGVLAAAGLGGFVGTFVAPRARRIVGEETLLAAAAAATATTAVLAAFSPGRLAMVVVAATLGMASNVGRRAFDSLVQREAPDVERGRLFARFETRFQLSWVIGALAAVALRPPLWAGLLLLGGIVGLGGFSYAAGVRGRNPQPVGERTDDSPAAQLLATARRRRFEGQLLDAVIVAAAAAESIVAHGLDVSGRQRHSAALAELQELRRAAVEGREVTDEEADRALHAASRVVSAQEDGGDLSGR